MIRQTLKIYDAATLWQNFYWTPAADVEEYSYATSYLALSTKNGKCGFQIWCTKRLLQVINKSVLNALGSWFFLLLFAIAFCD